MTHVDDSLDRHFKKTDTSMKETLKKEAIGYAAGSGSANDGKVRVDRTYRDPGIFPGVMLLVRGLARCVLALTGDCTTACNNASLYRNGRMLLESSRIVVAAALPSKTTELAAERDPAKEGL